MIGVLIEEGAHNAAFDPVWSNLPKAKGVESHFEHVKVNVDDLLPQTRAHLPVRRLAHHTSLLGGSEVARDDDADSALSRADRAFTALSRATTGRFSL